MPTIVQRADRREPGPGQSKLAGNGRRLGGGLAEHREPTVRDSCASLGAIKAHSWSTQDDIQRGGRVTCGYGSPCTETSRAELHASRIVLRSWYVGLL